MISRLSVKKPYTVLVAVVLAIVLGVVSLMKMTTDLLPDMSFQYALIVTTDVGASPESVETDVTAPIEAAMATTSNIKNVTSISRNSYSMVICEYEQNANMDSVVIEIQQKLDQLEGRFSDSVGTPMIMQINPDMLPIMITAVDVDGMSQIEIADYVSNELIPTLESIEGVASVSASGAVEERIEITLDQSKIEALNKKLADSISKKMDEAANELEENKKKIEDGKKELSNGTGELSEQTKAAGKQIDDKKNELIATREELAGKLEEAKAGQKQLEEAISEAGGIDAVNAMLAGLTQSEQMLESAIAAGMPEEMALETLNANSGTVFTSVQEITENKIKLETLISSKDSVDAGLSKLEDALSQIDEGLAELDNAADSIETAKLEGLMQMSNGYADLLNAENQIAQGQSQLDAARDSALEKADLNNILTSATISQLLVAQNFDMPAGYAYDENGVEYLVKVGEDVDNIEQLKELVLMDLGTEEVGIIHLADIAKVEVVDDSDERYAIVNGNPGIMLTMEKQSGYSTGEVTDRLLDKFDSLEKQDSKLHFAVMMNQGIYIDMVVSSVFQNMIFGAILAIFVLLLFLKDIKPTIIIACSIPLSVVTAVVLMYFTGISMNVISMSGLVLGIGMLVDNSIVVIENIYRLRSEGYSLKKAAVEGASQVTGAIIASTLTTVSVYAPIIFTEGITRQLFVDLALTIAYTLVASLVVALTLVPAMSSAMLTKTKEIKHPWFDKFRDWYGRVLEAALKHKIIVFLVAIVLLAGSAALSLSKGLDFMDMEMEADQMSATVSVLDGEVLEFDELVEMSNMVISRISDIEGIDTIGAMMGGSSTMSLMRSSSDSVSMYILLDENRKQSLDEIAEEIKNRTNDLPCTLDIQTNMMDMSAMMSSGLSINIKGRDLETLQKLTAQVAEVVNATEGVINVDDGLDNQAEEFRITVDKEKAAKYGYTVAQVFQEVYAKMASNTSPTALVTDIKDYDIYVQTQVQAEAKLDDITTLTFTYTNKDGEEEEIALSEIVDFEKTTTLSTIRREGQTRYLTVSAEVDEDHNVTLVGNKIQEEINKIEVPDGYSISMEGEDQTINEAMGQLVLMMVLAVIFIYLIMVAQFQSLLNPFIIMFSIPLAFTGGFIAIYLSGETLNVISMLGFIMLAGLIVNNGIVLIDYITQARKEGMAKKEAIIESGKIRMRPILMTALTTILAMSTSALSTQQGAEMMAPMAVCIIGGLIYGTVLTLIVIPCLYDVFNKEKNMVEEDL